MLTTFGMTHNQHSLGMIEKILTMDDLFGWGERMAGPD
jgi:hypothetical protein